MFPLFSSRTKKEPKAPSLIYDKLPKPFRAQVVHILMATVPEEPEPVIPSNIYHSPWMEYPSPVRAFWKNAFKILTKEFGVFQLANNTLSHYGQFLSLIYEGNAEECLDAIDLLFQGIDTMVREHPIHNAGMSPNDAVSELNERFKQHNLGYAFVHQLVRKDSDYIHENITEVSLALLRVHGFEGAEEEFQKAHKHFRSRNYREAIVFANSAFESTMKTICTKKRWKYDKNATAKQLINKLLENKLFPPYLETYAHEIQKLLESGTPVIRNKSGGHGQGEQVTEVPESLAQYALNLAGANILMLVQSFQKK
jgi:hypothetical protein